MIWRPATTLSYLWVGNMATGKASQSAATELSKLKREDGPQRNWSGMILFSRQVIQMILYLREHFILFPNECTVVVERWTQSEYYMLNMVHAQQSDSAIWPGQSSHILRNLLLKPITADHHCGKRPVAAGSHEAEWNKDSERNWESATEMKQSERLSIQRK